MRSMGYHEKIIRILESLYRDTFSEVSIGADLSEWFETIVGVLQGRIISTTIQYLFGGRHGQGTWR